MMSKTRQSAYRRQFLIFTLATSILVLLAIAFSLNNARLARAEESETLAYNHQKHVQAGIQCVFCHPGVMQGSTAGVPSTAKCMGCHANVQVTESAQADTERLLSHWEEGQPLQWIKTFDQPDFVYFSHHPHISAGVACEECHGPVGDMSYLRQTIRHNMGFCLACHRQPDSHQANRITQATVGGAWRVLYRPENSNRTIRLETCSTCHH